MFHDREQLWCEHQFEPLLEWVNDLLVKAKYIGLYQTEGGGVTWAKLDQETHASRYVVVYLKVGAAKKL